VDEAAVLKALSAADSTPVRDSAAERREAAALRRSLAQSAHADARAALAEAVARADGRSARRALEGAYVHAEGELGAEQLVRLVPRAVLALCPSGLQDSAGTGAIAGVESELRAVGDMLRVPACIMVGWSEGGAGKAKGAKRAKAKKATPAVSFDSAVVGAPDCPGLLAAASLHEAFQTRVHEIVDYSIRCYEPLAVSSFALGEEPAAPKAGAGGGGGAEEEAEEAAGGGHSAKARTNARLDALTVGSIWLEAYSRVDAGDRTTGTGRTKFSASEALVSLSNGELEGLPLRSSMVTAELHDNPALCLNTQMGGGGAGRGREEGPTPVQREREDEVADDVAEPVVLRRKGQEE